MGSQKDNSRHPDVPQDKLVLYVRKAIPAPTANSLKPLMILEALKIPYSIHLIKSLPDELWYHEINPYKQLPAMEDVDVFEAGNGEKRRLNVFDSTSMLIYLCEKYDKDGLYIGKTAIERAQVMNWLIAYAAGLGATGEWWLKLRNDPQLAPALQVIEAAIKREYDILEKRLSEPGQKWVALADRPTLADFAIQPLANPRVAKNAKIDFDNWPKTKAWSEAVDKLPYIEKAMFENNRLGMTEEEIRVHGR
ncbi:Glutathione S-transferase tcpG [Metarhizium brunneum]|uniref:glutathione transferase n=1 Tax=Metarhizium brunneum TaxID=500148 RepID=A0A7D5YZ85_9HYPO